jgi:hypothetical protein
MFPQETYSAYQNPLPALCGGAVPGAGRRVSIGILKAVIMITHFAVKG